MKQWLVNQLTGKKTTKVKVNEPLELDISGPEIRQIYEYYIKMREASKDIFQIKVEFDDENQPHFHLKHLYDMKNYRAVDDEGIKIKNSND